MWYYEALYPDIKLGVEGNLIYKKKTPYQELKIYDTARLGRVLSLDRLTQTTEKDEFIYHEMVTHPLLMIHPSPKKVLVIGAGDGGVLREILKYDIKEVYLVEIDEEIINASKKYLPFLSNGAFNDKRVKIIIGDGAKFIHETKEKFDAAVVDSPDHVGPAKVLFSTAFYKNMSAVLTNTGLMIRQTGSTMWQPDELADNYKLVKKIFSYAAIQIAAIPTYVGGFFSFIIASKKINPQNISYKKIADKYRKLNLKTNYYNPDIHFASLKLPNYIRRKVE